MSNFSLASEQIVFAYSKCHCLESKTSKLKNCLQKKQKFCWFFSYFFFYSKMLPCLLILLWLQLCLHYSFTSNVLSHHAESTTPISEKNLFSCRVLQTMVKKFCIICLVTWLSLSYCHFWLLFPHIIIKYERTV